MPLMGARDVGACSRSVVSQLEFRLPDPEREFVATDSTPRIDVDRTLRIAAVGVVVGPTRAFPGGPCELITQNALLRVNDNACVTTPPEL
jgi:hypothetical protein